MSLLDRLPHTCTAKRRRRTSDGMGGFTDTYPTTIFTDKACWRQRASDQEVNWYQARSENVTHRVFFNEDPGVDVDCVLEDGTYRYDVLSEASPDDSAGLGILYRVMVQRIGRIE